MLVHQSKCVVDGCCKDAKHKALCVTHYHRAHRRAAGVPVRKAPKPCSAPECDRVAKSRGLCNRCYMRARVRGELLGFAACAAADCSRAAMAHGLCNKHNKERCARERGVPKRVTPADGRYTQPNGYVMVFRPGSPFLDVPRGTNKHTLDLHARGLVSEHRFVMAEYLGRRLQPGENVHHRNGIRSDNRIENLELWSTSQPRGQRVSEKLAWCRAFIAQYENAKELI